MLIIIVDFRTKILYFYLRIFFDFRSKLKFKYKHLKKFLLILEIFVNGVFIKRATDYGFIFLIEIISMFLTTSIITIKFL